MPIDRPLAPPNDFTGEFRSDAAARAVYAEAAGIARLEPLAIAVVNEPDDVVRLVRWAAAEKIPLTARGSGSSMAGGALGPGVIVDMSRLTHMNAIDVAGRTVFVQPGVTCRAIDGAARQVGLRFPVDPSSAAFATIGGMCGTNAAGAHTLAFGATRKWIRALDCVFADGSRAVVRRGAPLSMEIAPIARFVSDAMPRLAAGAPRHDGVRKESSGYGLSAARESGDLVDVLVGSEGTLALFVGVEVALTEAAGATASVLAAFDTLEDAVAAAVRARDAGAVACELLERTFLDVARDVARTAGIPDDVEAALLAEVEGANEGEAEQAVARLARVFDRAVAIRTATDAQTEHAIWELRHAASPILSRLDPSLRSMQFIEDGAVPPDRLPEYVRGVRAALERNGTRGVIFGHAGDAHVHVNPLIDVGAADWRQRVARILDDVSRLTGTLGGTLTGEHGDGRLRTPLLDRVWSDDALADFAAVKQAFDPCGILNPGVKVPNGDPPFGEIKYDPELKPIPEAARAALREVESKRAYATNRLDLLRRFGA